MVQFLKTKNDTLKLEFNSIDISPLNYMGKQKQKDDPEKIQLNLRGRLNGNISFNDVYKNILIEGNLNVKDFSILGSRYGNIAINYSMEQFKKSGVN